MPDKIVLPREKWLEKRDQAAMMLWAQAFEGEDPRDSVKDAEAIMSALGYERGEEEQESDDAIAVLRDFVQFMESPAPYYYHSNPGKEWDAFREKMDNLASRAEAAIKEAHRG